MGSGEPANLAIPLSRLPSVTTVLAHSGLMALPCGPSFSSFAFLRGLPASASPEELLTPPRRAEGRPCRLRKVAPVLTRLEWGDEIDRGSPLPSRQGAPLGLAGSIYAASRSMICFTLRRSILRSRAIARWLWPALWRSRTVCSSDSTARGSLCASVGTM